MFGFIYNLIVITGTTMIGVAGAFFVTSLFVYSGQKADEPLEEITEEPEYEESYREQFNALTRKERPSDDIITSFATSDETPIGEVRMNYNPETNTYHYYCDRRTVPIRFLDVVAQKFAIDNDCKVLYEETPFEEEPETEIETNTPEEIETQSYYNWVTGFFSSQAEQAQAEQAQAEPEADPEADQEADPEADPEANPEQEAEPPTETSVFATYKKKPEINVQKAKQIEKVMNRYKYGGTLSDYDTNKEKTEEKALEISFTKYKEMVKNKTE